MQDMARSLFWICSRMIPTVFGAAGDWADVIR